MKRSTRIRPARERCRDVTVSVVVGVGVGYLHEGIDKGFAVVGDLDYEVLDGSWVERRWGVGIVVFGADDERCHRIPDSGSRRYECRGYGPFDWAPQWTGAGRWAEGFVEGVADLGDEPGGLGFGRGLGHFLGIVRQGDLRFRSGPSSRGLSAVTAGGGLLWAFAVSSIGQEVGGGDAVVLGGVVASLGDVVEQDDEVLAVIGAREYFVGESTRGVG